MTGEELRAWRIARGWTQAKAAAWWGCYVKSWQRYENNERPVPKPLAKRTEQK